MIILCLNKFSAHITVAAAINVAIFRNLFYSISFREIPVFGMRKPESFIFFSFVGLQEFIETLFALQNGKASEKHNAFLSLKPPPTFVMGIFEHVIFFKVH